MQLNRAIAALILCGACCPSTRAPAVPTPHGVGGIVREPSGQPAAGAAVLLTAPDGTTTTAVTDADGRFATAAPAGRYAVTAASARGQVWSDVADRAAPVELALQADCVTIAGTARGGAGAILRFLQYSEHKGDSFLAVVGDDQRFEVCLPAAPYFFVSTEGAFGMLPIVIAPPVAAPLELRLVASAELERPPSIAPIAALDAAAMAAAIPATARLIGLGEATHGTAEILSSRLTLLDELVRAGRVEAVFLECGFAEAFALERYVQGDAVDLRAAVASQGYWIWDTEEFLAMLEHLRHVNAARPAARRVHVHGIDVQGVVAAAEVLAVAPAATALTATAGDDLRALAAGAELAPDRRASLAEALDRLPPTDDVGLAAVELGFALRAMDVDRAHLPAAIRRRDAAMAAVALALLPRFRGATLWAHVWHVTADRHDGLPTMGRALRAALGTGYYAVGFFQHAGTTRAWLPDGSAVGTNDLPAAPEYAVDAVLAAAIRGTDTRYVPLATAPAWLRTWLELPRYTREVASAMPPSVLMLRDLPTAFDALALVPTGRATIPTPTGIRPRPTNPGS
jgi:erythromycin esterase